MFFDDEPHGVFFLIDNKSFYASCEAVARGLNPLKVPLVVLSEAENTNGGLILATSPEAKHLFHLKANVSRKRDLPNDPRLWVVPPRMNLYIQRNLQINQIFHQFTTEKLLSLEAYMRLDGVHIRLYYFIVVVKHRPWFLFWLLEAVQK
ncbi:Y-family DNA polymerase, partial [Lentilactobacillus parabuchneri]